MGVYIADLLAGFLPITNYHGKFPSPRTRDPGTLIILIQSEPRNAGRVRDVPAGWKAPVENEHLKRCYPVPCPLFLVPAHVAFPCPSTTFPIPLVFWKLVRTG